MADMSTTDSRHLGPGAPEERSYDRPDNHYKALYFDLLWKSVGVWGFKSYSRPHETPR